MAAAIQLLNETLDSIERRKYEDVEIQRIQQQISDDAYARQQAEQKQQNEIGGLEALSLRPDDDQPTNPLPSQPVGGPPSTSPFGPPPSIGGPPSPGAAMASPPGMPPMPPGMPPGVGMPGMPPQGGPQPVPPGQSSQPMRPPGPPQGMPSGPPPGPQGAPPPPGGQPRPPMAPQGSAIAPAPPAGWQPGVDGKAMLGGAQPQVPTSSDGTPLKPPPPPQTYNDPMSVYKWARKQGYSPDVAIAAMKESMVIADAHNQEMLQAAERENYSQQAAEHAAKAAKAKWDEEHPKEGAKTTIEKEAERLQELESQGKGNTTEAKALKAHIARMDRMPGQGGASGAGGFQTPKVKELLGAMAYNGVSLPAGFRSKAQMQATLEGIIAKHPEMSADELAEQIKNGQIDVKAETKESVTAAGRAGSIAVAVNELEAFAPKVEAAAAKLPRGQFIPFNKLEQMKEEQFSDPDLAEYRSWMTSLSNAYDAVAARGGTDKDKRAENRKNFDTAASFPVLQRQMKVVVEEAKAAEAAAKKAEKGGRGDAKETPTRTFKTEAEAKAAGLKDGTKVVINGVSGTWHN